MRAPRRLSLKREVLSELTPRELRSVVGGSHTCNITDPCSDECTHIPSYNEACPTLPVQPCLTQMVCTPARP